MNNSKICANCLHDKVHHNLLTGCMEMDNKGSTRHPKYEECRCKDFEEIQKKDTIDLGKINAPSASDEEADKSRIDRDEASDRLLRKAEGKGVGRTTETRPNDAVHHHCCV